MNKCVCVQGELLGQDKAGHLTITEFIQIDNMEVDTDGNCPHIVKEP